MMLTPLQLTGSIVRLEPLSRHHAAALAQVGLQAELWALQPRTINTPAEMLAYVELALDEQSRGASLPFAIVQQGSDIVMGSTRLMDIALPHRRAEIGASWIAPRFQRSGANVEAKLLLFTHAFETLALQKVVLKTETLNAVSRKAILALGAVEEGIFRQHLRTDDGRARDMIYFSVLAAEWPAVKMRLQARLQNHPVVDH